MEMLYCYCCRAHHPKDQMRLHPTRHGKRWRCLRSIAAAGQSTGERDAFGRRQTSQNQDAARLISEAAAHRRLLHPLGS